MPSQKRSRAPVVAPSTLADALRIFQHKPVDTEQTRRAHEVATARTSQEAVAALPELVYAHEHPLRVGYPGKLYKKYDCVTPICDAMSMLRERMNCRDALEIFDAAPKKARRARGVTFADEEAAAQRAAAERNELRIAEQSGAPRRPPPLWKCKNPECGNTDMGSQLHDSEGAVCPKCGVCVQGSLMVATTRERLGATEEDDKTTRADRGRKPVDPLESMAKSAKDKASERRVDAILTNVGSRKGLGGGIGDAQRIIERERARENRASALEAAGLTPREEIKRTGILAEVAMLCKRLVIDRPVQRAIDWAVVRLYGLAVRHAHACTSRGCCELRLVDRNKEIIARSVVEATVESILDGSLTLTDPIERERVVDLGMRMERSAEFSNPASRTQVKTARAMIALMNSPEFDAQEVCVACAPVKERPARASALPCLAHPQSLRRCDSSMSQGEDSPTNQPTEDADRLSFRKAIETVFVAHKSDLPISVRDGALRALQSPGFIAGCKGAAALRDASTQAMAFCVVNAVARAQADTTGPTFAGPSACELNVAIAHKLRLDLAVAEEAIREIRALVPEDAASEASGPRDDDLFA